VYDLDTFDPFATADAETVQRDDRHRSSVVAPYAAASAKAVIIGTSAGDVTLALARKNFGRKTSRYGAAVGDTVTIGGRVWQFALQAKPYADKSGALVAAVLLRDGGPRGA
jgi:hypothetical protein